MKPTPFAHFQRRAALTCAIGLSFAVGAATPGVETFDTDTAGFGPNTTSSVVVHLGAGGNPGGFIETRKDLTPPVYDIGALTATRSEFLGNYAAGGIQGVGVDLKFMTANVDNAWIRFRRNGVENGWSHPLTVAFPLNVWNSYDVAFDATWSDLDARANGWLTDQDINPLAVPSPAFATVLSSVGYAEVRIGSIGSTLVGIDNFRLSGPQVPEASTVGVAGLAVLALGMWVRRQKSLPL